MANRSAIISPPEADCFSFAARSAANENNKFLCDLCDSSPRRFLRGRAVHVFVLPWHHEGSECNQK
jgi:hypothetical protein